MVALVSTLAVFRVTVGEAEGALQRSGLDLDELHPAVRDGDQGAEQDAMGDVEVVLALDVPPGRSRSGRPATSRKDDDHRRRDPI